VNTKLFKEVMPLTILVNTLGKNLFVAGLVGNVSVGKIV
jgi:hypothetical protein